MVYTPTGLCASITENALYLVQMFEEGYSVYGKNIYKYNVETKMLPYSSLLLLLINRYMEQVFKSIPEMEMYTLSIQKTDGRHII